MNRSVPLRTIAWEWGRMGSTGFGGPPAQLSLIRDLCVTKNSWMTAGEFEDAVAATNMLPGPASTQMAILSAWRLRGIVGGIIGGLCYIIPGLILIVVLASLFLAAQAPPWTHAVAAGAGAAVPAVAFSAALTLVPSSWHRKPTGLAGQIRWIAYVTVGVAAVVIVGAWLVVALVCCGLVEVLASSHGRNRGEEDGLIEPTLSSLILPTAFSVGAIGGLGALAWVAFKVGALSYGGGFVIVPLMQQDAVHTYHWMTNAQFLDAIVLGQLTPGPVVQTVAAVGYAAYGVGGAALASVVAFLPSFVFVLAGARHFHQLRGNRAVQAFLAGAGPASIGAIAGSAIPFVLGLAHIWQIVVLAFAALWLLVLRRGVVLALLLSGLLGFLAVIVFGLS